MKEVFNSLAECLQRRTVLEHEMREIRMRLQDNERDTIEILAAANEYDLISVNWSRVRQTINRR